jgi:hypothetical protein
MPLNLFRVAGTDVLGGGIANGVGKESDGLTCAVATGDFSHLASIFILLHKIIQLKVRFCRKQAINRSHGC